MSDKRVELILSILGKKEALDTLQQVIQYKKEISNTKADIRLDTYNAKNQLQDLRNQIANTKRTMADMLKTDKDAKNTEKYKEQARHLSELEGKARAVQNALKGYQNSMQAASGATQVLNDRQKELIGTSKDVRAGIESIANAFNKIGDVSGMIGNFASGIGNAFSGMAGLFQSNFIDVVGMKLTAMMTEAFVGHGQDVIARADILNTFEDYMEITGVTADKANEALDKVDQSIRGLPIGLDESAQRLRRYQMFLGDIDKATNITIGLQKAITAGGANESMKRMAYYQIDRLLSVGELSTARQWNSLITGLGVSVKFLAEAMGEGEMSASELAGAMLNGQYSAEQLLDALAKLGEGGNEGLEKALEIYKGTYESWLSNIRFAMTRGGEKLLSALTDTLEVSAGKTIIDYMKRFRDGLNEMYSGIADWVRKNPDLIGSLATSLERLVDAIQSIQFGTFGTSFFGYLTQAVDLLSTALMRISGVNLAEFVAFATTIAGPLGKLFAAMSLGLPILIGIFERFKDFDWQYLIDSLTTMTKVLATAVEGLLNIFSDKALANILSFGLVFGKPVQSLFHGIASSLMFLTVVSGGAIAPLAKLASALDTVKTALYVFGSDSGLGSLASILGPIFGIPMAIAGASIVSDKRRRRETEAKIPTLDTTTIDDARSRQKELQRRQTTVGYYSKDKGRTGADYEDDRMELEFLTEAIEDYDNKLKLLGPTYAKATADEEKFAESIRGTADSAKETVEAVKEAVQSSYDMQAVYEALGEARAESAENLQSTFLGMDKYEGYEDVGIDTVLKRINQRTEAAKDYTSNLEVLKQYLEDTDFEGADKFFENLTSGTYGDAQTYVDTIADAITSADFTKVEKAISGMMELDTMTGENGLAARLEASFKIDGEAIAEDTLAQAELIVGAAATGMENATSLVEASKAKVDAAADIKSLLIENTPSTETAAEVLGMAVANGIMSAEQAVLTAAEVLGSGAAETIRAQLENIVVTPHINLNTPVISGGAGVVKGGSSAPPGGMPKAHGGLIYASTGKLINGPQGTDTIPAWLTAGEFVQNRRAVNYFGLPFMQYVNNLDLTGALKSLLSMRSIPAFSTGGSVTNNHTKDIHPTQNFTIVSNNPHYPQRVAVKALNRL